MFREEFGYGDAADPFYRIAWKRWQTDRPYDRRHSHAIGEDAPSCRAWFKGIHGELAFANDFYGYGARLELRNLAAGDRGHDFTIGTITIDVKASRTGIDLLVEASRVKSELFVLAHYKRFTTLLGWLWRDEVLAVAPRAFPREDIINHVIPQRELRTMLELHNVLEGYL